MDNKNWWEGQTASAPGVPSFKEKIDAVKGVDVNIKAALLEINIKDKDTAEKLLALYGEFTQAVEMRMISKISKNQEADLTFALSAAVMALRTPRTDEDKKAEQTTLAEIRSRYPSICN